MVNPGAGGGPTPPSPLAYHELLNERDALRRRLDRLAVEVSLVTCHKCGGDCALMHLTDGRCPKCLAAEVIANGEAIAAEVVRLAHAEAEWRHVMADREHLLKELTKARADADDYRAVAAAFAGALLGAPEEFNSTWPDLMNCARRYAREGPVPASESAAVEAAIAFARERERKGMPL